MVAGYGALVGVMALGKGSTAVIGAAAVALLAIASARGVERLVRVAIAGAASLASALVLWLVTGADKRDPLAKLLAGDGSIPAGRVEARDAVLVTDVELDS